MTPDEPGKKDDVTTGATGDKCVFKNDLPCSIQRVANGGSHVMWSLAVLLRESEP